MRTLTLLALTATLALALVRPLAADDKPAGGKPIVVELKSFKFKGDETRSGNFGFNEGDDKLFFYSNGTQEAAVKVPEEAEYTVKVKASCDPALNERAKFKLSIDGDLVGKETLLTDDGEKEYTFTAKLKAGERKLAIEFTNDVYKENEYDRNLYVHGVSLMKKGK
jgi:hypothetical protein